MRRARSASGRALTLQERVHAYAQTAFAEKWPDSQPYVSPTGRWLYGTWCCGNLFQNGSRYPGAFPRTILERILALFPDVPPSRILHVFAGSVPKGEWTRLDINPAVSPEIVGSVYDVPRLLRGRPPFELHICDPPYRSADRGIITLTHKRPKYENLRGVTGRLVALPVVGHCEDISDDPQHSCQDLIDWSIFANQPVGFIERYKRRDLTLHFHIAYKVDAEKRYLCAVAQCERSDCDSKLATGWADSVDALQSGDRKVEVPMLIDVREAREGAEPSRLLTRVVGLHPFDGLICSAGKARQSIVRTEDGHWDWRPVDDGLGFRQSRGDGKLAPFVPPIGQRDAGWVSCDHRVHGVIERGPELVDTLTDQGVQGVEFVRWLFGKDQLLVSVLIRDERVGATFKVAAGSNLDAVKMMLCPDEFYPV